MESLEWRPPLENPGVDVEGESGIQLLPTQNSSAAATYVAKQLARIGIPESDVLPWNANPWFKGSGTSKIEPSEMLYGEHALRGLLMLTPELKVVVDRGLCRGVRRERHSVGIPTGGVPSISRPPS